MYSDRARRIREIARQNTRLSHPAFDYAIANPGALDGVDALGALDNAAHTVANEGHPAVQTGDGGTVIAAHRARRNALQPEVDQVITAAKARKYTGWSNEARGRGERIRYAD